MVLDQGSSTYRAGRYQRQIGGYQAFMPESLPPEPPVEITGALQSGLSDADRALGRLDGSIETLPHPDLFVFMYVRKEAVLSSQIEGTQSSLQDLLAAEANMLSSGQANDVDELVNYLRAMNYGLARLGEIPMSVRLMREMHAKLLAGARGHGLSPGEFRTSQNWIGPAGCTLRQASFVPPPPHAVPWCLSQLEQFIHADTSLPLLIKIGLIHAQFETIHPFLDGNGRLGRLIITFLLCEQKVLLKPVLYLSWYFKRHRQQYYDELQSVRDNGTWEQWLVFFLKGVEQVSIHATDTARRILALRETHRDAITQGFGRAASNGHRVLEHIHEHPFVSVNDVQELIGTSYSSANNLVARLVESDILREYTGHARNRRFAYQSYIDLFHDAEEMQPAG